MEALALLGAALAGALIGGIAGLLPGVHAFSIAGAALLLRSSGMLPISDQPFAMALVGLGSAWAVTTTAPAVFLYAPDESSVNSVLPATRMLLNGRGIDAAVWIGAGSAAGIVALIALAPVLPALLRPVHAIIQPHSGWMLLAIVAFLLLGEWPWVDDRGKSRRARLAAAWAVLGAGLLTFVLSGILGIALALRSPVAPDRAFQNLAPAMAGLFVMPGLAQLFMRASRPPAQQRDVAPIGAEPLVRGALTGLAGGLFAGMLPVVSGGIGALLAGHATAQRHARDYLVAQGASRSAYYAGSLLLLFAPGLEVARGGLAGMLSAAASPHGAGLYALAVCATALSTAVGLGVLIRASRMLADVLPRTPPRAVAAAGAGICCATTVALVGLPGLGVLLAAFPIGCIPLVAGGRRLNALGVLIIPAALAMTGWLDPVARGLGLAG